MRDMWEMVMIVVVARAEVTSWAGGITQEDGGRNGLKEDVRCKGDRIVESSPVGVSDSLEPLRDGEPGKSDWGSDRTRRPVPGCAHSSPSNPGAEVPLLPGGSRGAAEVD